MALTATALLVIPAGASSGGHYSATAEESLADIQAYWADAYPGDLRPPSTSRSRATGCYPYSSDDPPPGCGTRGTTPYREVAGNAFYCEEGDFIAYDVEGLIPALQEKYGDVAIGLVLAHEMGHAIQARGGAPDGAFVYIELQADCFAGAWTQHVADGDDTDLRLSTDDLDRALSGLPRPPGPVRHRRQPGRRPRQRVRPGERVPGRPHRRRRRRAATTRTTRPR